MGKISKNLVLFQHLKSPKYGS